MTRPRLDALVGSRALGVAALRLYRRRQSSRVKGQEVGALAPADGAGHGPLFAGGKSAGRAEMHGSRCLAEHLHRDRKRRVAHPRDV